MVRGDISPYRSPKSGKWIESRVAQERDLRETGSFILEPGVKRDIEKRKASLIEADYARVDGIVDNIVREMNVSGKLDHA